MCKPCFDSYEISGTLQAKICKALLRAPGVAAGVADQQAALGEKPEAQITRKATPALDRILDRE